ncbi:nuclease-related domain-containing protein [Nocardia sp. BMG111209]|uniref:nuclease-related domain-containing protein n=1 Tax=Nocardia sp. BMG111209 TaxID=1160137 RepID=UPI0018CA4348|nr:nuclease-related domain-containing protein [Nocardia sp. BMG111209]
MNIARRVPYREFSHVVRRFHRDQLLDKVAEASAAIEAAPVTGRRLPERSPIRQFTLAAIARTALAESMTYRTDQPVSDNQLKRLCGMAIEVDQPDIPDHEIMNDAVMRRLMARMSYQQFLFGQSELEDITRTLALFVDHDPSISDMPTPAAWEQALKMPLPGYLALVWAIFVRTGMQRGHFTDADLAEHADLGALGGADAETARTVIDTHLSSDTAMMTKRAADAEQADDAAGHQLWLSNPLVARPLIRRPVGYLAPIDPYVLDKVTPRGMYFTGIEHFGDGFPNLVGASFEKLVGRHLQLLEPIGAQVYPEIRYGRRGGELTCDYIVVMSEFVLLVETKAMRSVESARLGHEAGLQVLADRIQKARNQIATTATLIRDRISEVAHIPDDRPIRGLVVTLEPIHLVDTLFFADLLQPTTVDTATTSAHDFEQILATLIPLPDAASRILEALTARPPVSPVFARAVDGLPRARNQISAKLWDDWSVLLPRPR